MFVKILSLMAGPNGVFQAGSVIEVTRATGGALIAGRYAVEVQKSTAFAAEKETTDAPLLTEKRKPAERRGGKQK